MRRITVLGLAITLLATIAFGQDDGPTVRLPRKKIPCIPPTSAQATVCLGDTICVYSDIASGRPLTMVVPGISSCPVLASAILLSKDFVGRSNISAAASDVACSLAFTLGCKNGCFVDQKFAGMVIPIGTGTCLTSSCLWTCATYEQGQMY